MLVAGGAGFVGSQVTRDLAAAGAEVTVVDDLSTGAAEHVANLPLVRLVVGDVLDTERLATAFRAARPDLVVSLVGDTFVPESYVEPRRFFRINVEGTLNILMAAKRAKVSRVLYASSTEVYGEVSGGPASESHPLDPLNTYAVSKLAADRLCFTFQAEHGLPVVIARLFNCYGPRATRPYVIPEIISQLAHGPTLDLGNLDARRDFTHVTDTSRALLTLLAEPMNGGEVFNVGSGRSVSVRDLVSLIAPLFGYDDVEIRQDATRLRRLEVLDFVADASRLRALGWAPEVDLPSGLAATVRAYQAAGSSWLWERRGTSAADTA